MAPPLASHAELEAHLQRPVDLAAADLALAGASGVVRSHCRWSITRETTTFVVDGSGATVLGLPTLHLVEVTEVRLDDGQVVPAGREDTSYRPSRRGQLYRPAGWPGPFRQIEVDCVHGYDPVPEVVRMVTLALAARQIGNPQGLKAMSTGTVSRTFHDADTGLTALDLALLDAYRLP